jgi:Reverse transcriptase (RNA-dependent DNA polymerase)
VGAAAATPALRGLRPYMSIRAKQGDQDSLNALYDTGAVTSVLSPDALSWFRGKGSVLQEVSLDGLSLTAANGDPLPVDGAYRLRFYFHSRLMEGIFVVVPRVTNLVIIGMNIILPNMLATVPGTTQVCIGSKEGPAMWSREFSTAGQDTKWQCASIRVHKSLNIQPHTAARVRCKLVVLDADAGGRLVGPCTPFFGHIGQLPIHAVTDEAGFCSLYVSNATDDLRYLARNDSVGEADNHTLWERTPLTAEVAALAFAQHLPAGAKPVPPGSAATMVSAEKRSAIAAKIKETLPPEHCKKYTDLLLRYADLFSDHPLDLGLSQTVTHAIHLRSEEPVYVKQFTLAPAEMDLIRKNLAQWKAAGLIEPARSLYNSPVFVVRKKDTLEMRTVCDYRLVNQRAWPDRYSIRSVDSCLAEVGHAKSKVFTAVDLSSSFWQLPLEESSRDCTAFTVPGSGQWRWRVAAMGLSGSPATFSRLMDQVVSGLPNVLTYIDDGLVHSPDHRSHLTHLANVLERFRANHLKLNLRKCVIASGTIDYLGHTLSPAGVGPGTDKVAALRDTAPPTSRSALKSFLGAANWA